AGLPLGAVIGDVEARKLPPRYVIEVHGSKEPSMCLQPGLVPLTEIGNYDGLCFRARTLRFELAFINAAGTEQQGVAGLERFLVHAVEASPCDGRIPTGGPVVPITRVHKIRVGIRPLARQAAGHHYIYESINYHTILPVFLGWVEIARDKSG